MKKIVFILLVIISLYGCNSTSQQGNMSVATYNLRYDNAGDADNGNGWQERYPVIASMILFHGFDIFGTQEGYAHQLEDLNQLLPDYQYIGVGRDDGEKAGEHSAIFYRKDLFELIDHGDFWMSQTPETPSIGWDAVLPRICSWGHFRHKKDNFEFLFFNLHMDHIGKEARVKGGLLVKEKIKELGNNLPAIVTGDFNVDQTHDVYVTLLKDNILFDSYEKAEIKYATNGTFQGFNPDCFTDSRIDHIFVTPEFHVLKYGVLTDMYWIIPTTPKQASVKDHPEDIDINEYMIRIPSDHFPVKVVLEYEIKRKGREK